MNGNKPTNFDGKTDGGGGEGGERSTLLHVNVAQQQILRRPQPEPLKCNFSNTIRPRSTMATVQSSSLPASTSSVNTTVISTNSNVQPLISKTVPPGSSLTAQMASIIRGPMGTQQGFVTHPTIQATYSSHLPRGAAAVACITTLKPAVATPIARSHILASNVVSSTSGSHHVNLQPRIQGISSIRGTLPTVPKSTLSMATDISHVASSTTSISTPTQIVLASSRTGETSLRSSVVHGAAVISKSHQYVQQISSLEKGFYKPNITSATILPTQVAATVPVTTSHAASHIAIGQQASSMSSISVTLPSTITIPSTTQIHLPLHQQLVPHSISLAGAQVGSISPSIMSSSISHTHANLPKVITPISHFQQNSLALSSRTIKTAPISTSVVSQTGTKPMVSAGISAATIPVAKVFPQPIRPDIITHVESNRSGPQTTLFVSPTHRPTTHLSVNANPPSVSTGIVVSSSGTPSVSSNVLLTTDNRTERSVVGSSYNFTSGQTYFYEPVSTSLTMHSISGSPSAFASVSGIRTGYMSSNSAPGVKSTSISTVAMTPVMMTVTSTRPQNLIETNTSNADTITAMVSSGNPAVTHSSTSVATSSPIANASSSPRPSILRKRAIDGSQVSNAVKRNLLPSLSTSLKMSSPQLEVSSASAANSGVLPKPATNRDSLSENGQISELANIAVSSASALNVVIKQETIDNSETSTASSLLQLGPGPEASPRKKPRKQQLTGNELVETHSTEGEEEFEKESKETFKKEVIQEDTSRSNWISRKNRSPVTLLNSYRHTWKSRHNHFLRYTDVKPREERRPNIFELVNQKYVAQKVNGWKVHHICAQMEDVVDLEGSVHSRLISLLDEMEKKDKSKDDEDIDLDRTIELMRGNIQRCKLIKDQMKDAKQQVLKVLEHKIRVSEIVSKYVPKQSSRRREKMFLF